MRLALYQTKYLSQCSSPSLFVLECVKIPYVTILAEFGQYVCVGLPVLCAGGNGHVLCAAVVNIAQSQT